MGVILLRISQKRSRDVDFHLIWVYTRVIGIDRVETGESPFLLYSPF
jgi:hypothetical protein